MSLYEITGQESGIVIYDDKVIVANWSSYQTGLPIMSPFGTVMEWPEEKSLKLAKQYSTEDIRDILPGRIVVVGEEDGQKLLEYEDMVILEDHFGDIPALWGYDIEAGATVNADDNGNLLPTSGTVYHINDAVVIAPHMWG